MGMMSRERIIRDAPRAMREHQFRVFYQPLFDVDTGNFFAAEALSRWEHPELGYVYPNDYISVFEENNFISEHDLLIFEEVCSFINECTEKGIKICPISVNLSRHDVYNDGFVEKMEVIRDSFNVSAGFIQLEVLETIALNSVQEARRMLNHFHEIGYSVMIDDFGTGFSSLCMLKDICYDMIKLDQNFIDNDFSERSRNIIRSIINMAKDINTQVIVEGVETSREVEFLKDIGCRFAQGYYYSKPITKESFIELLNN